MIDRFEEIRRAGDRLGIRDPRLKKDVLCIGPCPGLWKTYYAACLRSEKVREVEKLEISQYLGIGVPRQITRKHLGEMFEAWVKDANESYNRFLESEEISDLDRVPGVLGEYYAKMANLHLTDSPAVQRAKTILDTEEMTVPKGVLLYALNPDGVFTKGERGAIFESKLSRPDHPEFLNEIATYAIALERVVTPQKDVDCAIVLYSDFPDGQHLATKVYPIHDSNVNDVSRNIERFLRLIQTSETQRKVHSGILDQVKHRLGRSPGTWKDFLVRPERLPEVEKRTFCAECRFRIACYKDGGEPDGFAPMAGRNP